MQSQAVIKYPLLQMFTYIPVLFTSHQLQVILDLLLAVFSSVQIFKPNNGHGIHIASYSKRKGLQKSNPQSQATSYN